MSRASSGTTRNSTRSRWPKPWLLHQPLPQLPPSPARWGALYRDRQRLPLSNQHDEALAPGHTGVDQVSLQHPVVLGGDWDDHSRILGSLALVDRHGVGQHQLIEFGEPVNHLPTIEVD